MKAEVEALTPFNGVYDIFEDKDALEDVLGLPVMTKSELQKVTLEHGGYGTPGSMTLCIFTSRVKVNSLPFRGAHHHSETKEGRMIISS